MIGYDLLGFINFFGRQAVEERRPVGDDDRQLGAFGGLNAILVGYPMQLPPVGSSPVWVTDPRPVGLTIEGLSAWLSFNAAVELTEVIRMGPEQASFRETQLGDTEGIATMVEYNLRRTRLREDGSVGTKSAAVDGSIHSFSTNDAADTWHWERLHPAGDSHRVDQCTLTPSPASPLLPPIDSKVCTARSRINHANIHVVL